MSIEAGAIWRQAYDAVTTKGGRYVQGGGCMTVGVAGLVLGRRLRQLLEGLSAWPAASLLEAEIVTADGEVRIANACTNPDLFWALKGGGGGFGVVTRLTLRTHALPEFFGGVFATIKATSDDAYRRLIAKIVEFYAQALFNPHWGEQIGFGPGNVLAIAMVFQGLDQQQAEAVWRPFFDWVAASPQDFDLVSPPRIVAVPGALFLGSCACSRQFPGSSSPTIARARRRTTSSGPGTSSEAGQVWHAYQSAWLPARCSRGRPARTPRRRAVAAAQHWRVTLHVNKGLAGATPDAIAGGEGYGDESGGGRRLRAGDQRRARAARLSRRPRPRAGRRGGAERAPSDRDGGDGRNPQARAPRRLLCLGDRLTSEPNWQDAFWGDNYARLRAVKDKYDPDGLFFLHHGVGSEDWSADGFTRA